VLPESLRLRILVVDDDPSYSRLVSAVVKDAGYGTAALAASGAEALGAAREADLVLLDYQLPDTTGLELLPGLRSLPNQPAIILVTACGDEALAARALRAGADDYLIKDGSLPRLLPEVIERVRRHRALAEALAAAERDLVHAERLAAIGQLNVTLRHNINNPLMAAFAETEMLLQDPALNEEQRAGLGTVKDALQRISEILERVSSLGHAQTTEYLAGVPMIDLSRRTRPTPAHAGEAVIWLPDEDLARVVALLLRHGGFAVERVPDLATLATRAHGLAVSVVVITGCDAPGVDPLSGFVPQMERGYTLVALMRGDGTKARAAGADHTVMLPFDPGTFVNDLLAVMR
jgi:DNA-binding response OmpR family regulator